MKHYKLPFDIRLQKKYDDINIDEFISDWKERTEYRKERTILLDNEIHMELGKFETYEVSKNEVIDLALRYALSKREFRRLTAQIIEQKINKSSL